MATNVPLATKDPMAKKVPMATKVPKATKVLTASKVPMPTIVLIAIKSTNRTKCNPRSLALYVIWACFGLEYNF